MNNMRARGPLATTVLNRFDDLADTDDANDDEPIDGGSQVLQSVPRDLAAAPVDVVAEAPEQEAEDAAQRVEAVPYADRCCVVAAVGFSMVRHT